MASNNDSGGGSNGALSRNFPTREYDVLKQQFEKTNNELSSSRRRCDLALNDLDYYREQHRAVMNQLEVSSQDSASLRNKYTELLNENKQLESENQRLCNELAEHNGSTSEALFMSHTQALSKLEAAQDENARLAKQCDVLVKERDAAQRDVASLKQQLVKDYAKYREAHQKLQQKYEETVNVTIKANKDIKRLTDERNATMAEYTLVMSERDTVHKEMEKLSDDLTQAMKKIKLLDSTNQELQEEKRGLIYQLESLRREITSALHERDKALKECNDLREKFGDLGAASEDGRLLLGDQTKKSRGRPIDSLGALGDGQGRKEHLREDARSISHRQRLDNLDQANQELESLRKSLDKAQTELAEAVQEAEVSKGRRDWAFSERDKIVLERESIRTLCDNMRKERDRAVSELAESLRESDAVKKQRNELLKETKALREALEAQLERESKILSGEQQEHSCGHTEVVEFELSAADKEGLEFAGGRDFPGDGSVYVASVAPGSPAIGKLFPHDRILRVNDVDCSQSSLRMVTEAIRSSVPVARVLVKRNRCARNEIRTTGEQVTRWIHTARLAQGCHGLSLKMGVYINRISDGSLAARDKSLTVGDRVLKINDKSMDDVESAHQAMQVLNDNSTDVINITMLKMSYPECPNVFTPARRNKKENRSSQTEDWLGQDYHKYGGNQEKNNGGAWLKEKFDMVRGPWRHSKEDKKKYRNSSPNPIDYGHEQAIAELDLVLDSYHHGTIKRSGGTKRHTSQTKEEKNNGGTWPKARAAPVLAPGGGTVITRTKERPPLSLLAPPKNNQDNYNYRNSTPVPLSVVPPSLPPSYARHSVYKSVDASHHFGMATDSFERLRSGNNANRLSVNVNSDNSLDYPVHRFVDKEVLSYYKKNNRSGIPKYGSDSERDSIVGGPHEIVPSHSRGHSQLFVSPRVHYPFHPHPHPHLNHSRESFSFEPFHHVPSPSVDVNVARRPPDLIESGGTFPRKNQRFRVPSNPSVTSKVSTGSIERGSSERGSPMPIFQVEVLSSPGDHSGSSNNNQKDYYPWGHKPVPGELRRVHIDKSNEPLGIQINCPDAGGIFVSTVNENSLASRVGLQIGDQLLEVCGINMRNATYNLAANVLRQCGNSITMLVQYSPDKYNELDYGAGSCSGSSSNSDDDEEEEADGEATPCNSPKEVRKSSSLQMKQSQLMVLQRQAQVSANNSSRNLKEEPRYLCIETLKTSNLGISLVGGNAAGIFIHSVQPDSLAYHAGLRTGDQILEYNGSDLRTATAEEAAYELAKPADKVTVLAHYRISKYNEIKDKPGDNLYIRCGFDRSGNEMTEPPQLSFSKDDVLYVDNTMFNGVPGQWRAWRLDGEGHRQQCGVIPSKYKVEEELLLRRGTGDAVEGRTTATARRSFFRRKKHQRGGSGSSGLGSGSRDSKELASFCNLSPGWYSDSGSLHEDLSPASYQRVERLQYPEYRPVLVLGPLAECVADKLVSDFPDKFNRAATEARRCSQAQVDRELEEGTILEYRRRGSCYECVTVAAVRLVAQSRLHCMLDGSIATVERLRRHRIHPVVLLIKFKSTKQIREVKDARYSLDKLSGKAAKEMFEHGHKLEAEYRHLVTAVVSAGANVAHVCAQVKAAVDAEHRKSQWVVAASLH